MNTPLRWTDEQPTASGLYWVRHSPYDEAPAMLGIDVEHKTVHSFGTDEVRDLTHFQRLFPWLWYGPVECPPCPPDVRQREGSLEPSYPQGFTAPGNSQAA
mgnify:CR=1 FL=1